MSESTAPLKILTLLNVAQAKPKKRAASRDWHSLAKQATKKQAVQPETTALAQLDGLAEENSDEQESAEQSGSHLFFSTRSTRTESLCTAAETTSDPYEKHWAPETTLLGAKTVEELATPKWTKSTKKLAAMGAVSELSVAGSEAETTEETTGIVSRSQFHVLPETFADNLQRQVQCSIDGETQDVHGRPVISRYFALLLCRVLG